MTEYDCQKCGACCRSPDEEPFVYVSSKDEEKLPSRFRMKVINDELMPTKKTQRDGYITCAALQGRIGEQVKCEIYTKRPKACVMFDPGSFPCLRARQRSSVGACYV